MTLLQSIANVRDLGGLVLPDGGVVRGGLLLRGGALSSASEEDLSRLHSEYHVARIFDFRTSMEVKRAPDLPVEGAVNIWLPAFDETSYTFTDCSLPEEAFRDLGNYLVEHAWQKEVQEIASRLYVDLLDSEFTLIQYAGFLQNILATESGAVYWHCSQGKDRTGLAAAFLLAALGADRELIMRDYSLSAEYYREELESYTCRVHSEQGRKVLRIYMSVDPPTFSEALDLIDSRYGSMSAFLHEALLLSDDDIRRLRDRYIIR